MSDHRIPAIERALDVLDALAREPGASITALSDQLQIPRSTVYRILNSLEDRAVVVRDAAGNYDLGPQLIRLAASVSKGVDVVAVARPFMERLAAEQMVTVKLSILDQGTALVVAVAESPKSYSVTTKVGSRFPLHAGAASKVLLANAPAEVQRTFFSAPLLPVTPDTIVRADALRALLSVVREQGYSEDRGEYVIGVNAVAAPVYGAGGQCVCAVSVPYISNGEEAERIALREGVIATARQLTAQLGGRFPA